MVNRNLFSNQAVVARTVPAATTMNDGGGVAYDADPRYALALYGCTGTFHQTFYATDKQHLDRVQALLAQIDDPMLIAKVAVYGRKKAFMKDVPAYLLAHLTAKSNPRTNPRGDEYAAAFQKALPLVLDNGKMLSTYSQMLFSRATGRRSGGTRVQRALRKWFDDRTDEQLFHSSIGISNPSLEDVIRMVRPKAKTPSREALYKYFLGNTSEEKGYRAGDLPELVKQVEAFKKDPEHAPIPDVSFQLLSSFTMGKKQWTEIALNAPWQTLRMNLNTFGRHGVFEDKEVVVRLANKLQDEMAVGRSKVFPYQILVAYLNTREGLPPVLSHALHNAMEIATRNVPVFEGRLVICPDVSVSMSDPVTGTQKVEKNGRTTEIRSKVRCIDAAALMTACILRKNPEARVIPFCGEAVNLQRRGVHLEPQDTIMTNAQKLSGLLGGGTNCAAPLELLCAEGARIDGVLFASDYESWMQSQFYTSMGTAATPMALAWAILKSRNPNAKIICNDLTPKTNLQLNLDPSALMVGGFSDEVFNIASKWIGGKLTANQWLGEIEAIEL